MGLVGSEEVLSEWECVHYFLLGITFYLFSNDSVTSFELIFPNNLKPKEWTPFKMCKCMQVLPQCFVSSSDCFGVRIGALTSALTRDSDFAWECETASVKEAEIQMDAAAAGNKGDREGGGGGEGVHRACRAQS